MASSVTRSVSLCVVEHSPTRKVVIPTLPPLPWTLRVEVVRSSHTKYFVLQRHPEEHHFSCVTLGAGAVKGGLFQAFARYFAFRRFEDGCLAQPRPFKGSRVCIV